jgi:hypothetical protein
MPNFFRNRNINVIIFMMFFQGAILFASSLFILIGGLLLTSSPNFLLGFFYNFVSIFLRIAALTTFFISIPFFMIGYGLYKTDVELRSVSLKMACIGLSVYFLYILLGTFLNSIHLEIGWLIPSMSIGIVSSIICIYYLYRSDVKRYFEELENYYRNMNLSRTVTDNIHSLLTINRITLLFKIILITEILVTFAVAIISILRLEESYPPEVMTFEYFHSIINYLVIAIGILWFSKAYKFLIGLGVSGLQYYSVIRPIISFFVPIKNLYEPLQHMKTLWKASDPIAAIYGVSWKNVVLPTGFGTWWFFALVSRIDDNIFVNPPWVKDIFIDPVLKTIADVATILITVKIIHRLTIRQNKNGSSIYIDPSTNIRLRYPSILQRNVEDDTVVLCIPPGTSSNIYPIKIWISNDDEENENIDTYIDEIISDYRKSLVDFNLMEIDKNIILAGHSGYRLTYQYRNTDNLMLKDLEVGFINNHKSYCIIYESEAEEYCTFLPLAREIIDSLELTYQSALE